jgi:hypothetical protein
VRIGVLGLLNFCVRGRKGEGLFLRRMLALFEDSF